MKDSNWTGGMKIREFYYKKRKEIAFSPKLTNELMLRSTYREGLKEFSQEEAKVKSKCHQLFRQRLTTLNWRHEMIRHALMTAVRNRDADFFQTLDSFLSKAYSHDALFEAVEAWLTDRDTDLLLKRAKDLGVL